MAPETVVCLDGRRRPATRPPREIVRQAAPPHESETKVKAVRRNHPMVAAADQDLTALNVMADIAEQAYELAVRSVELWRHSAPAGTPADERAAAVDVHHRIADLHMQAAKLAEAGAMEDHSDTQPGGAS
jgi:hypothetical protein